MHLPLSSLPTCLQTELGESTAALFTRDGEQANNLFEMQAVWYEVASGRAYLKQQQYGKVGAGCPLPAPLPCALPPGSAQLLSLFNRKTQNSPPLTLPPRPPLPAGPEAFLEGADPL